jgi:carboxyl-terminal processing protease
VILDLRGNPGGLKDQAIEVTSEFLKDGEVFIDQDAHGKQTAVPVTQDGMALDLPLCVLIDGGTASAAEICAGALQDYGRAKLVGERTFGTGTVLQRFPLSDGSEVLLATSQWLTPKGRQIWHKGITPDVEVALPEAASILLPEMEDGMDTAAFQRSEDAQLHKAIEILRKEIQGRAPDVK